MASATLNHQLSSRDVVAAAVDCGRQLLVMVSKFASSLRAAGSYEPEVARTETSDYSNGPVGAVYRSRRSRTKADDGEIHHPFGAKDATICSNFGRPRSGSQ